MATAGLKTRYAGIFTILIRKEIRNHSPKWFFRRARRCKDNLPIKGKLPPGWMEKNGWSR